jgi:hypothetical protein
MTTLAGIAGLTDAHHRDEAAHRLDPLLPTSGLAGLGREAVAAQAANALATQLDDPLDQLVIDACEQDAGFRERVDATTPDRREPTTVTLGRRTISRVEEPRLELELGNTRRPLLEMTLSLEFTFTALALDVMDGRVVRIHPNDAEVSVSLTAAGAQIVRREKVPLAFPDDPARPRRAERPTEAGRSSI